MFLNSNAKWIILKVSVVSNFNSFTSQGTEKHGMSHDLASSYPKNLTI